MFPPCAELLGVNIMCEIFPLAPSALARYLLETIPDVILSKLLETFEINKFYGLQLWCVYAMKEHCVCT